jgi:hypothetical protein
MENENEIPSYKLQNYTGDRQMTLSELRKIAEFYEKQNLSLETVFFCSPHEIEMYKLLASSDD